MADEGELAFAMTLRDEATKEAKGAKAQLEALGGETRPIETPVKVKDQTASGLASASKRLDDFGKKAQRNGRMLTTHLTLPLIGLGGAAVSLEATYDRTMRQVAIATGAPTKALDELAQTLGAKTQFSAGEAASAMLELAKSGMSAATIKGGALNETMRLAAAGSIDLTSAATDVSNELAVFHLRADQAAQVTTALAGAANASSASVDSLSQGMAQAAQSAKASGLSIQETAGALSLFDSQGLKGSDAGTSFKTMLTNLIPQTTKAGKAMEAAGLDFVKGNGEFESLANIADQLHDKLGGLSQAQRRQALTTIFGSDAFRAANILTDGGRKAVEKYTKAARDQKTTQELANAAMEGTSGALERAKGSVETAGLAFGKVMAPYVEQAAAALESAANWLGALDPKTQRIVVGVGALAAALGPATYLIGSMSRGISSTLNLVDRFRTGLDQTAASETKVGTQGAVAASGMGKVARAAKIAAGVGGLAAMVGSATMADGATSTLLSTLGGAATGFAIGGPIGLAVGALGGYATASHGAETSQRDLAAAQKAVVDTLNAQTGAFTKRTRQMFLDDAASSGLLTRAHDLGVNIADLTDAVFGGQYALEQWRGKILATHDLTTQQQSDLVGLTSELFHQSDALTAGQKGWLLAAEGMRKGGDSAAAAQVLMRGLLDQTQLLPKQAQTVVKMVGADKSRKDIRAYVAQLGLTPEQVRTIMSLEGIPKVKAGAGQARRALEDVGHAKPDTRHWSSDLLNAIGDTAILSRRQAALVALGITAPIDKSRANVGGLRKGLHGDLSGIAATSRGDGTAIGNNISQGAMGPLNALAAAAAAAVRRAVAAAKAAAGGGGGKGGGSGSSGAGRTAGGTDPLAMPFSHTAEKGGKKPAHEFGLELIQALIDGFTSGSDDLATALDRVQKQIEAHFAHDLKVEEKAIRERFKGQKNADAKIAKAIREAENRNDDKRKKALKALRDETAAIKQQATIREGIASQLADAYAEIDPAKFAAMGRDFRDQLRQFASVTSFQPVNDAPITAGFLQQHLDAQLAKVQAYVGNLAALRGRVSDTILKQLEEAGADNGAAYAAALAQATPEQIAAINATQAAIDAATEAAGVDMGNHWHALGVAASAGLIAGLEADLASIDEVGAKLARRLRHAILKELGIKSPSRVLRADMRKGVGPGVAAGILDSIPEAERAAALLSARVASAASVDASTLAASVNAAPGITATTSETITIRHEVVSPDGSLDPMTADQVADLIARDPKSAGVLENALKRARRRIDGGILTASDSTL